MAEIYTKPFGSVQAAITLFEQKIDPKNCSTGNNEEEKGGVLKDLEDSSLLLEAKEHEKSLTFFEINASSKSPLELLALLKLYKAERDNYKEKFRRSQALFLEYEKAEHYLHSVRNLEADDESRTAAAQRKDEVMKTEPTAEEVDSMELLKHSSEIKKGIFSSKFSNMEARKHSSAFCSAMEEDLKAEVFQSQIQLEDLRRQSDEREDLENELLKQTIISEYLQMELRQSREAQTVASKAVLTAMNELYLAKAENGRIEQVNSENESYIHSIEEEGRRMKEELNRSSEKIDGVNCQIEMLVNEIQRMQEEMSRSNRIKAFGSQPNASVNESEANSMDPQAGSNQAIRPLPAEAANPKPETEDEDTETLESSAFTDADSSGFCSGITISTEEYELLIRKSEMADLAKIEPSDIDELKREAEDQNARISELRCLLEEAERRAELSENAKVAVESQLRKWRDQRRLRRAASDAVKEYCAASEKEGGARQREKPLLSKLACINPAEPRHGFPSQPERSHSARDGRKPSKHHPLGKLLKLKF